MFAKGVDRLLENVLQTLTAISLMSLSATVLLGVVGAMVMYVGARQIFAGTLTLGGFVTFTAFLAFLVAPVFQVVGIGTQLTEALAGLDRTQEVLRERPEDEDPKRTRGDRPDSRRGGVRERQLRLRCGQAGAARRELRGAAGHGDRAGGLVGIGEVDHHQPGGGVPPAGQRAWFRWTGLDLATVRLDSYRTQLGVVLQDTFLFDGTHPGERAVRAAGGHRRADAGGLPHRARGRIRGEVREAVRNRSWGSAG